MWYRCHNLVVWKSSGRTEIYDEQALRLNIERCKNRLITEELNDLTYSAVENSIEFLEKGLKKMQTPNLIMCCGPQGSGKSTWARQYAKDNPEIVYLSTDDLRAKLGKGPEDQTVNGKVWFQLKLQATINLKKGKSVLLDATFIDRKSRKEYIQLGRELGVKLIAHVFNADKATLLQRLEKRAKEGGLFIPTHVLEKYLAKFEQPDSSEFDEIINH